MNKLALSLMGIGLFYLIYRGSNMLAVDQVRGMRNKNPMNLKDSSIDWEGETGRNKDPVFEEFKNHSSGIRAGAKLLINYQKLYGLNTVRGLINRYAPPSDNNPTNIYVDSVASRAGVDPDEPIQVKDHLLLLVKGIINFEIGQTPFSDDYIYQSIREFV